MADSGTLPELDSSTLDENVVASATPTDDTKINLTDLPDLVLERILDFLLTAKDVKDTSLTPGHKSHIRYNFSTSIMRVNKGFYTLATPIFERNHFVLVSCTSPNGLTLSHALRDHSIWFKGGATSCGADHDAQRRISRYKSYHLRLQIVPYTSPQRRGNPPIEYVVVCLDNIEDLVRALRLLDTVMDHIYDMKFDFRKNTNGTNLNLHVQKGLLQPFLKLHGRGMHYDGQKATIVGSVDGTLARKYEKLLSPSVHWQRQRVWEMYETMLWKKNVADRSFECGDIWTAHDQYLDFKDYYSYLAHPRHHELTASDDVNIRRSATRLIALTQINFHMVCLLLEEDAGFDEERTSLLQAVCTDHDAIAERSYLTSSETAVNHILCGIAHLLQGSLELALEFFENAVDMDLDVEVYSVCLWEAEALIDDTTKGTAIRNVVNNLIKSLTKSNFFKPLKCTRWKAKSVVKSADVERHELKKLGYTGDLLHDLVKQKKGWTVDRDTHEAINEPFNPKTIDSVLDDTIRRDAEEERTTGKRHQRTVMMPRRPRGAHPVTAPAPTGNHAAAPLAQDDVDATEQWMLDSIAEIVPFGAWMESGGADDTFDNIDGMNNDDGFDSDDGIDNDPWLPPTYGHFSVTLGGLGGMFLPPPGPASQQATTAQSNSTQLGTNPADAMHGTPAQGSGQDGTAQHAQPHAPYQSFTFPPFPVATSNGAAPAPPPPSMATVIGVGMPPTWPPQGSIPQVATNWPQLLGQAITAFSQPSGPANAQAHPHGAHTHSHGPHTHAHGAYVHDTVQSGNQSRNHNNPTTAAAQGNHAPGGVPPPGSYAQGSHTPNGMPPPGSYAQPGMGQGQGYGPGMQPLPPNCQQM